MGKTIFWFIKKFFKFYYFSAILHSRTSRQGEVLFSVNGTPVTISDDITSIGSNEIRDQAKIVQDVFIL